MDRARHSVDVDSLQRNRRKEIATSHPSLRKGKGKGRAGSSSQSREDFDDGYQRRDGDAMSDEQLLQLLAQNDGHFFQQQNIPESIDEEELEDDDAEEDEGGDGTHGTPDDEQELEDEDGPSQVGKKSKSPIIENNFTKRKDPKTDKWYASCDHCKKEYSLGTFDGYGRLKRHLKSAHSVEYAKIDKGKGKQTQKSRFVNDQPFGNFSYTDAQNLTGTANLLVEENLPYLFSESLAFKDYAQTCLNPQFRSYSRKTVKKEIIMLYRAEKDRLQKKLQTLMAVLLFVLTFGMILIIIYIIWA
ncbi:unnamed protein product [Cuscuta epithymum]|uniref:BED-type domain-containing protein n=1 Tax=Cuscuta epithymum TaxID=186058 RepID=A0AAV0C7J7_9ASTE|nr:unnamed protein product [Cuscuta epithymum]